MFSFSKQKAKSSQSKSVNKNNVLLKGIAWAHFISSSETSAIYPVQMMRKNMLVCIPIQLGIWLDDNGSLSAEAFFKKEDAEKYLQEFLSKVVLGTIRKIEYDGIVAACPESFIPRKIKVCI